MEISLDYPNKKFKQHIESENNSRILFSGKFGIGKTYFLKKYFDKNEKFAAFHLYPTNYQINQNEDIFELIKFDILLKLIEKGWLEPSKKVNNQLAIQSYFLANGGNLLSPIIKSIPKIGKAYESFEKIYNFFDKYKEYVNSLKNNNFELLKDFGNNIENKKGSIYEQDSISNLIYESIELYKENRSSILIIDDLDRIDPEHVFRILNIFSAHFDLGTDSENKFNFDKIIVVCDLINLENIFYSKFGNNSDFHGYIDKFYSNSCFVFSNKTSTEESVNSLINEYIVNNNCSAFIAHTLNNYVLPILIDFIHSDVITLRDILHIQNGKFNENEHYSFYFQDYERVENWGFDIINTFSFLDFVFGNNKTKLQAAIKNCSLKVQKSNLNKEIIKDIIMFVFPAENIKLRTENELLEDVLHLKFTFKIKEQHGFHRRTYYTAEIVSILNGNDDNKTLSINNIYYLLEKAYNNIQHIKKEELR